VIEQSHGGSGKQHAPGRWSSADVVTLALAADIDQIAKVGKIRPTGEAPAPKRIALH
jgi:sulfate transport system substrate-binding protein